jgi:hypothetical protein
MAEENRGGVCETSKEQVVRVNSQVQVADSADAVEEALLLLTRECHPISATGGWFPTGVVARRAGVSETSALERLREMQDRGAVEPRRLLNDSQNFNRGFYWRMTDDQAVERGLESSSD